MDYRTLYEWGSDRLLSAGIDEGRLDARLLLEAVCRTGKHDLLVHGDRVVLPEQEKTYADHIDQRRSRKPLQYILGYQEFMGLRFIVTPQVLIPRQDTEILVEEVLRYRHDGQAILDMCTGSGCILLSVLNYSNNCRGIGVDSSPAALAVAADNADHLNCTAEWLLSDLFTAVTGRYDIIVSNPPYIPRAVIDGLMPEVRDYEPMVALDGEEDGLAFYRRIVAQAGDFLLPEGRLFLEIGFDQAEAVTGMMVAAGYLDVTVTQDLSGLDRVIGGRIKGNID
ncbi:MAG: peptide chain release factor N(5)-glutamine methyltransferase [Lachnospiraceae bacterium]|jgi:release factor glutamine methyltransferase|nr:peptide chain release factor N(5)-glutamine methyltransferase [Lachnospiraceae bacterium]